MTEQPYDRESDVDTDEQVANTRPVGGDAGETEGDAAATTGTGVDEEFVGRVGGQDSGYAGETGAEARHVARDGAEPR
jgi:hypothetical protein